MSSEFAEQIKTQTAQLSDLAQQAVQAAMAGGADECEAAVRSMKGLSVSSLHSKTESVEFNHSRMMEIVVYKGGRRGCASTTDLSLKALHSSVEAALDLADTTDPDPCAGICALENLADNPRDLKLLYPLMPSADDAAARAVQLEQAALELNLSKIKDSDGAEAESSVNLQILANSHGRCLSKASSCQYSGITLLGQSGEQMQRGSGYTVSRKIEDLWLPAKVAAEAAEETVDKLDAKQVPTGVYPIILTKRAALSLWGHLIAAISGGSIYRKASFLQDKLNEQILPEFISIHEDPWIEGGLASAAFDADGAGTKPMDIVTDGKLNCYLLSSYTARKLKLKNNAHAGGTYNWQIHGKDHEVSLEEMLSQVGRGLVISDVMGQGVNLVSGNYSRGASGYFFDHGKKVHAVEGITIAGNLKDMLRSITLIGTDIDPRSKIACGSLLLDGMTVSGS